ncbi:hypothetical protein R3P38DRAFT_3223354 [Favolaschia claudopus]|uniref:Uncharacterized protein n=1 Tax=Favolaschia claudopus TaxID=2862362 RepID=A0AAV9ZY67_9AGAR
MLVDELSSTVVPSLPFPPSSPYRHTPSASATYRYPSPSRNLTFQHSNIKSSLQILKSGAKFACPRWLALTQAPGTLFLQAGELPFKGSLNLKNYS